MTEPYRVWHDLKNVTYLTDCDRPSKVWHILKSPNYMSALKSFLPTLQWYRHGLHKKKLHSFSSTKLVMDKNLERYITCHRNRAAEQSRHEVIFRDRIIEKREEAWLFMPHFFFALGFLSLKDCFLLLSSLPHFREHSLKNSAHASQTCKYPISPLNCL